MRTNRTCAAAAIADAASLRRCDTLNAVAQRMLRERSFKATMIGEIRNAFSLHYTRSIATRDEAVDHTGGHRMHRRKFALAPLFRSSSVLRAQLIHVIAGGGSDLLSRNME